MIAVWKLVHGSNWGLVWGAVAAALIGCALGRSALLSRLNDLGLRFGLLLHSIVNPVIMVLLFFGMIAPIGLLMRALGKDPLRLKFDKAARSYWIARSRPPAATVTNASAVLRGVMSFLLEFFAFLRVRKKYWLMPVFLMMFVFGGDRGLAKGSVVAPFIYTLF